MTLFEKFGRARELARSGGLPEAERITRELRQESNDFLQELQRIMEANDELDFFSPFKIRYEAPGEDGVSSWVLQGANDFAVSIIINAPGKIFWQSHLWVSWNSNGLPGLPGDDMLDAPDRLSRWIRYAAEAGMIGLYTKKA